MITRFSQEKLTAKEIEAYFGKWQESDEYKQIRMYKDFYEVENPGITGRYTARKGRGKKPNNFIPSAYYKTLVDEMGGYEFGNVKYSGDDNYAIYMEDNNDDVKTMKVGTHALAYNMGVELVYTVGDGKETPKIKFAVAQDPLEYAFIYNTDIEPVVFCAIRRFAVPADMRDSDSEYYYDVIYSDEWQYWKTGEKGLEIREDPRTLYFSEVPVINYRAEPITGKSPFHQIIVYINALDFLLSGNSDEIERLVDAVLVLGKTIPEEQREHPEEWKFLEDFSKDDRAEYLTKSISSDFRNYVSQLLIDEIYRHGHVVDWYNPQNAESSGRALQTKMFDMDMRSKQIEKTFRDGAEKRLRLIAEASSKILAMPTFDASKITITFNRHTPTMLFDLIDSFKGAESFIPLKKMWQEMGFDVEEIQSLYDKQMETTQVDVMEIKPGETGQPQQEEAGAVDTGSGVVTLNGAQVTAAKGIIQSYSLGELSLESATNMMKIFFNLDNTQAKSLFIGINPGAPNDDVDSGATGNKVTEAPVDPAASGTESK